MDITLNVSLNIPPLMIAGLVQQLAAIQSSLNAITKEQNIMSKEMDDLVAEVAEVQTTEAAAEVLIGSLVQRLADAGTDKAKLAQLRTDLEGSAKTLHDAIVANTPAADPAPVDPAPVDPNAPTS